MLTQIQMDMLECMNQQHKDGSKKATIAGDRLIGKSYLAEHIIKLAPRDWNMVLMVCNQSLASVTFKRLVKEIQPVKASIPQNTMCFFQQGVLKVASNADWIRGGQYDLIVIDGTYVPEWITLPVLKPTGKLYGLHEGHPTWFDDGAKWIHR